MIKDLWPILLIIGIAAVITIVLFTVDAVKKSKSHQKTTNSIAVFNSIKIGDSKNSVLSKMGSRATKSLLRDGSEKYEWRIRILGGSSSFYYKGAGTTDHTNGYVIRMTIKFKNGVVVEKLSNNTDYGNSSGYAFANYNYITIGMDKARALELLGGGYAISLLKNGEEKYTWKIRIGSTTHSYRWFKGYTTRDYSGSTTKKVTVVFKNGVVIEKTAANL